MKASRGMFSCFSCGVGIWILNALLLQPIPELEPDVLQDLEKQSHALLGVHYGHSPLGEDEPPDSDPRFRLDQFDCTTFVETVLALVAQDFEKRPASDILDGIRYQAPDQTSYAMRRHLMGSQWIPGMIKDHRIIDVTTMVGQSDPSAIKWVKWKITPKRFVRSRLGRKLKLPIEAIPSGEFELPYLTVDFLKAHPERVPPGSILSVVRKPTFSHPDVITHQAFVFTGPWVPARAKLDATHLRSLCSLRPPRMEEVSAKCTDARADRASLAGLTGTRTGKARCDRATFDCVSLRPPRMEEVSAKCTDARADRASLAGFTGTRTGKARCDRATFDCVSLRASLAGFTGTRTGNAGERFVRHASPVFKKVVDESWAWVMRRYQKPRKTPILGIHLALPQFQEDKASDLSKGQENQNVRQ